MLHDTVRFSLFSYLRTGNPIIDGIISAALLGLMTYILNNLNLFAIANHTIEITPTDLESNIAIFGAAVTDVNLANLSYQNAKITKQAHLNGTGTDVILTDSTGVKHIITLWGNNDLASIIVYAPLNSQLTPTTGISGDITGVSTQNALATAANSAVHSISVSDTGANIIKNLSQLTAV